MGDAMKIKYKNFQGNELDFDGEVERVNRKTYTVRIVTPTGHKRISLFFNRVLTPELNDPAVVKKKLFSEPDKTFENELRRRIATGTSTSEKIALSFSLKAMMGRLPEEQVNKTLVQFKKEIEQELVRFRAPFMISLTLGSGLWTLDDFERLANENK